MGQMLLEASPQRGKTTLSPLVSSRHSNHLEPLDCGMRHYIDLLRWVQLGRNIFILYKETAICVFLLSPQFQFNVIFY